MNSGELALVQSNSQLGLQPEAELQFADFLINQAMDSAFCLGAKAQFLYVNNATCRMSEYSREELLAMTLRDIDIDFSLHEWSEKWRHLTAKGSVSFKSRYRTKRGRICLVEISITYLQQQGREFGCAFARQESDDVIDLSLVHAEKKVHFLAMASHQFRTPLNVVSFSNSLLKRHLDEWTGEKIRSLLARIETSVGQINQLLDDILFLAKAEAAKLNFEPKRLDLVQFCHELVAQMQMSDSQNRINFVTQANCCNVCMDERLLEVILKKLLDNAIKYSPSCSPVDLKLSCENERVIFQIQNQGIGISPTDRQQLFDPFYRGSKTNNIVGNGLGLSIVKALVDLHNGKIAVDSEVDLGTTVTVILPLVN
ncbi:sensor histidine kinase KdpD [Calothrix sp. PCC 7507]|uniref:sensor histidine kinase n=1 Tax=Calothrix sp. PCC 7507 TaxID=99598 RepID=UPI00029EFFAA|nr:HAMP domain-containing sensor histidine kinase [Calothrix sp. PCC 7507]AFY36029.1 PAS/PAC sensor signal transduction histidine kinase [Calothrix sp. PCC 7507]